MIAMELAARSIRYNTDCVVRDASGNAKGILKARSKVLGILPMLDDTSLVREEFLSNIGRLDLTPGVKILARDFDLDGRINGRDTAKTAEEILDLVEAEGVVLSANLISSGIVPLLATGNKTLVIQEKGLRAGQISWEMPSGNEDNTVFQLDWLHWKKDQIVAVTNRRVAQRKAA